MSNLNQEGDIVKYMENSIVKDYRLTDKGWEQLISYDTCDGKVSEWCGCYAVDVSVESLLIWGENLISELSLKEEKYAKLKEEYDAKEFEIVFLSDINFKELYGSTSEKVRKQHASNELKPLKDKLQSLELSIDYLKRYTAYIQKVVSVKMGVSKYD